MQYRTLGKTQARVSVLGFGAMRLPHRGKETDVDEAAARAMIRWAIDQVLGTIRPPYSRAAADCCAGTCT